MTPVIEMKPLSLRKRQFIFGLTIVLFILAVPVSVFYAIGYRFDFTDTIHSIKSVGGMYVRNDVANTAMYINDNPVSDVRTFQKAAYIQNLEAGMHRIHVQGADVQTWVKELPVYAHFVTEVASFNLPKVPQIRLITQWNDMQTNEGIVFDTATSTQFAFASTTNTLRFSSTTATSTFALNTEYAYIKSLFASSTALRTELGASVKAKAKKAFSFDVATSSVESAQATSTKLWRNFKLFKQGQEVVIAYEGNESHVPYYYCVNYEGALDTTLQYGKHVYDDLLSAVASSSATLEDKIGDRVCRREIHIDRGGQKVLWFDYFPDSTDIVLMQLEDGLYAVEVDDRAWQNKQQLYPGKNIEVLQDGGRIYVHDGKQYLEVYTEVSAQN